MKKLYLKPTVIVHNVFVEESIAGGSSRVQVGSQADDVTEEWEIGADDNRYFEWN